MPLLVFSLMLVVFGLTTGEFVIAGILPDVARDLSVSIPAAGLLVSAYAVGMIAGGPVITTLTARLPRRPLIVGLIVTSIAGNAASALAPTYPVLLAGRFVAGLVVATFFAVAIATAVSTAPPGRQASTVARLTFGMNLGMIAGTPLGTFVGQNLGWRATFAAIAVFTAIALTLVLRSVPDRPAPDIGSLLGELRVFTSRDVVLAIALTAAGNLGVVTVFTYMAPLSTDVSGFPRRVRRVARRTAHRRPWTTFDVPGCRRPHGLGPAHRALLVATRPPPSRRHALPSATGRPPVTKSPLPSVERPPYAALCQGSAEDQDIGEFVTGVPSALSTSRTKEDMQPRNRGAGSRRAGAA
ncbi:MFS transporter [Nonomuraea dietziae]|uniref:MFS transporter n=1 Tax=Nonomuraea dietziae TaxID=65515 RepID=UPI0033EC9A3E